MLHPTRTAPTRPGRKAPEIGPTPGVAVTNPDGLTPGVEVTNPDGLAPGVVVTSPDDPTLDVVMTSPDGPTFDVEVTNPDDLTFDVEVTNPGGPTLPQGSTPCRLKTVTVTVTAGLADPADLARGAGVAIR
jgi:hypothetical protein